MLLGACSSFNSSKDSSSEVQTPSYDNGQLTTSEPASVKRLYAVAEQAMKELGIRMTSSEKEDRNATLAGLTPTGQKIFVVLKRKSAGTTEVRIVSGSRAEEGGMLQMLLGKMENHLLTKW